MDAVINGPYTLTKRTDNALVVEKPINEWDNQDKNCST